MKKTVEYEVYADSVWGSDVITCDTKEEAIERAKEWKKDCDKPIVILEITKEIVEYLE